ARAPAQERMRVESFERPAPVQIPEPAAMEVERSDTSSSWVVRPDRLASAPVIAAATSASGTHSASPVSPGAGLAAQEVQCEAARVAAVLGLEVECQVVERQEDERQELVRQDSARQETARQ